MCVPPPAAPVPAPLVFVLQSSVYVIRTLRDFFHMGSVLCVTFQLPDSQDRGGGVRAAGLGDGVEVVEGWRRVIRAGCCCCCVGREGEASMWGEAIVCCVEVVDLVFVEGGSGCWWVRRLRWETVILCVASGGCRLDLGGYVDTSR